MESGSSKASRRRPWREGRWALTLVVGWLVAVAATAQSGYLGPFKGRVVDAETRQPIPGTVVFVRWDLGHVTVAGRVNTFYDAAEVLTDEHGQFRIKRKWSSNPWANWMLEGRVNIFKGGYGVVSLLPPGWKRSRLEETAMFMKSRTEEERRGVGPSFYFNIEFDDGLPVFLLRKLTTNEERSRNMDFDVIGVPDKKYPLLRAEENRERKALGLEEY